MESHMGRFRLRQAPTHKTYSRGSSTSQGVRSRHRSHHPASPRSTSSASSTARPWSRSEESPEQASLRQRVAWLESVVQQSNLPSDDAASYGPSKTTTVLTTPAPSSSPTARLSTSVDDISTFTTPPDLSQTCMISEPSRTRRSEDTTRTARHDHDDVVAPRDPLRVLEPQVLVDAYYRDINRAYPSFIERRHLLDTMQKKGKAVLACPGPDADCTIAYLVMVIGLTSLQRADYDSLLSQCLHMEEGLSSLRILLLMAIYSYTDPDCHLQSTIVDILARRAIRLGLTKRETADRGCLPTEAEQNRRLFWGIYTLDRTMAVSMGSPVALNDVNMDILLPGITVDEFAGADRPEHSTLIQVHRQIIQLRVLEDRVLHEVHLRDRRNIRSMSRADRRTLMVDLRTEIEDWYSNGCLLQSTDPDNMTIHIRISWLSARYYNLLLLLYYPSLLNPDSSLLSRAELLSFAQKHIQANATRLEQNQLPSNHVTLCRLSHVCMVFLFCFVAHAKSSAEPFPARDEVLSLWDILRTYPSGWEVAHRMADVIRQLASLMGTTKPQSTARSSRLPGRAAGGALSEADWAWLYAIRINLVDLAQQVMGRGTAYRYPDHWEEQEMDGYDGWEPGSGSSRAPSGAVGAEKLTGPSHESRLQNGTNEPDTAMRGHIVMDFI